MNPSEEIKAFLDNIQNWRTEYQLACEVVNKEDKRLQDLLHALEFSKGQNEKNRVATELRNSRRARREAKDKKIKNETIVQFFEEEQNRKVLNKLTQILGRQRHLEELLESERTYTPRVSD